MITIKRKYRKTNKKILKILNSCYFSLNSVNFVLDNENYLYFVIDNDFNNLYYNYQINNYELFSIIQNTKFKTDLYNINSLKSLGKYKPNIINIVNMDLDNNKDYELLKKSIFKTINEKYK